MQMMEHLGLETGSQRYSYKKISQSRMSKKRMVGGRGKKRAPKHMQKHKQANKTQCTVLVKYFTPQTHHVWQISIQAER